MIKDSFVIYTSFYEPIKGLSDKQLGRLFRALFDYQKRNEVQVDSDINMAFCFFKNQMDIDREKYQKIIERNKQNGSKGGRRSNEEKPKGSDRNPKNPVGYLGTQTKLNDNDNDNDNDIPPSIPPRGKEEDEIFKIEIPNDGVKRNLQGLEDSLNKLNLSEIERQKIILLSNYGEIGHQVWGLIAEISKGGIKLPAKFILKRLETWT